MTVAEGTLFVPTQLAACVTALGGDPSGVDLESQTAITELLILATTAPNVGGASSVNDPSAVDAFNVALDEFCQAVAAALAPEVE